ncbi:hypothetical protein ACFL96_07430 [Thermoproteota archaeon]
MAAKQGLAAEKVKMKRAIMAALLVASMFGCNNTDEKIRQWKSKDRAERVEKLCSNMKGKLLQTRNKTLKEYNQNECNSPGHFEEVLRCYSNRISLKDCDATYKFVKTVKSYNEAGDEVKYKQTYTDEMLFDPIAEEWEFMDTIDASQKEL